MSKPKKTELQEIFQRIGVSTPKYITVPVNDGQTIFWTSTVELHNGEKYSGEIASSKKEAESSAASLALASFGKPRQIKKETKPPPIKKETNPTSIEVPTETASIILVDVENKHKIIEEILAEPLLATFDIVAVLSKWHHLSGKNWGPRVKKILSPSSRSNGSDTFIQVYTGTLLQEERYENYFIATGDSFGHCLAEMITSSNMPWPTKSAWVVVNIQQILEKL